MVGGSDDELERLERLDRLRQSGALTQSEFEEAKARVFSKQADQATKDDFEEAKARVFGVGLPHNRPSSAEESVQKPQVTNSGDWSKRSPTSSIPMGSDRIDSGAPSQKAIAWSVLGVALTVVCLGILFLPYSGVRNYSCSSPLVEVFDSPSDWNWDDGFPPREIEKDREHYVRCTEGAKSRVGLGVVGLVLSVVVSGGGYLATRRRPANN